MDLGTMVRELGTGMLITTEIFVLTLVFSLPLGMVLAFGRMARLKVLKADHQSKQYRLEDQLLKYFPAEIEKHHEFIRGLENDIAVVAQNPLPKDHSG